MCVIAVAGCGEVFPSVDSGTADLAGVFYACEPEILRPGMAGGVQVGNTLTNIGTVGVSVTLRPTG